MIMVLSDVTKALEMAVATASAKKALADKAKEDFDKAAAAAAEAVAKTRELHTELQKHMTDVLSNFGQVHR